MKRFILSVGHAAQGNIRVQLVIGVIVVMAGILFSNHERRMDGIAHQWYCDLELMNMAVEGRVDLISRDRHLMAGKVKMLSPMLYYSFP